MPETLVSATSLALSVRDGVAELVFDLPGEKHNMLRESVLDELEPALIALASRTDVRCLVLSSGKPGSFVAGADLREIAAVTDVGEAAEKSRRGQEVLNRLSDLPLPTIASIDGPALGGGLELALACDYRIVSDDPRTSLGLPETSFGIIPGFGGTYRLPRVVGLTLALRMIVGGKPIDGPHAAKAGLADACVPAAFLRDKTAELARRLAAGGEQRRPGRRLLLLLAEDTPPGRALLIASVRRQIRREAAHYPALGEAVRVLARTAVAGRAHALAVEREAVSRLIPTAVSKNLIRIFFAREEARRDARPLAVRRAAVVGAGVMGGRIAWLFSRNDVPVVIKDIDWEAVRKGFAAAFGVYQELMRRRRFTEREVNFKMHRISGAVDYRSLGRPDLVVEAVVENLEVKKKVLAEIEARVGDAPIIASNTSSLSITEMAAALKRPERFCGMHFFNPPNIMPLVEVIPGARTSAETTAAVRAAAVALGKTPILVRDSPGFLVNRLLMPYLNECVRLASEGWSPVVMDRLLEGFGMPMGPFRLLDEIGIDVAREVARVLYAAYGARMEPSALFATLARSPDLLGKKSGRGFYVYGSRRPVPNPRMRNLAAEQARGGSQADLVQRPLLCMINEAARALDEEVVASAEELDLALVLGTGFPAFRGGLLRYADSLGLPAVRDGLKEYADRHGERFAPVPRIERLAAEGKSFYAGA